MSLGHLPEAEEGRGLPAGDSWGACAFIVAKQVHQGATSRLSRLLASLVCWDHCQYMYVYAFRIFDFVNQFDQKS